MQKFILLAGATLALAACNSGDKSAATATADTASSAAAPAASDAPAQLAAMPTAALSGTAATDALKKRHDWFKELGGSFKTLARESKSGSPDMAVVQKATAEVAAKSAELPSLFAPGTGPDAGKTEAKAKIWQDSADFLTKAKDFQTEATKLNAVASAGDAAGFKEAFGKTGGTCKACHDSYREKD